MAQNEETRPKPGFYAFFVRLSNKFVVLSRRGLFNAPTLVVFAALNVVCLWTVVRWSSHPAALLITIKYISYLICPNPTLGLVTNESLLWSPAQLMTSPYTIQVSSESFAGSTVLCPSPVIGVASSSVSFT